jgi:dihydrofolate reductase
MRKVTYSMGMTLDGFFEDPDGDIGWGVPSPEVFQYSIDEIQTVGVHLMGRKLYETMRYWETVDPATLDDAELVWRDLWNPLPKVVFSRTLTEVEGDHARLATGSPAEEIERLRAEPGEGDIAIGGAELAAEVAGLGLIDEYVIRVFPVLVGGGTPLFARDERLVGLELVSSRTFDSGVVALRYRVAR